jgi:hypothetical protein
MHEAWHRYVPGLAHDCFYTVFAFMLITDPQIYTLVHGVHHFDVNSWEDTEFHPLGRIANPIRRRLYNSLEIIFGNAFVQLVTSLVVSLHPRFRSRYRLWLALLSPLVWVAFLGGLGYASQSFFGIGSGDVAFSYLVSYWLGAVILHHSQLVEHGNLIVAGDWPVRNVRTRNLRSDGLLEKIFLFLTHNDSREHVLHHTQVRVYSRPFPGLIPLPAGTVAITLRDYLAILRDMVTDKS